MTTDEAKYFLGSWECQVWYPNRDDDAEETTINRMTTQLNKGEIVLTSLPNKEDSYMIIRLSVDDEVATGRWHESTSPTGKYGGAMYSGAGQMLVDYDKRHMKGLWAGTGYDHSADKLKIYTGRWELTRAD
jgi:hypothetical protein